MKLSTREKGRIAEDLAEHFLKNKGYEILDRNFERRYGELDIVARVTNKIVFFEVKSVLHETYIENVSYETFYPAQNMHEKKLRKLLRTINSYLSFRNLKDMKWELKLITVSFSIKDKKASFKIYDVF
jgi:putative endonuclease